MAKPELPPGQLRKRAKVVARTDLRGVPQGTPGKVVLVNGFAWVRYWVHFDNGVYLGTIDRSDLATADEWTLPPGRRRRLGRQRHQRCRRGPSRGWRGRRR